MWFFLFGEKSESFIVIFSSAPDQVYDWRSFFLCAQNTSELSTFNEYDMMTDDDGGAAVQPDISSSPPAGPPTGLLINFDDDVDLTVATGQQLSNGQGFRWAFAAIGCISWSIFTRCLTEFSFVVARIILQQKKLLLSERQSLFFCSESHDIKMIVSFPSSRPELDLTADEGEKFEYNGDAEENDSDTELEAGHNNSFLVPVK